jgi:hypothetical protein
LERRKVLVGTVDIECGCWRLGADPHLPGGVNDQVLVAAPSDTGKLKSSALATPELTDLPMAFGRKVQEHRSIPPSADGDHSIDKNVLIERRHAEPP